MKITYLLLLIALSVCATSSLYSQKNVSESDVKNADVENMSDQQVLSLMKEIKKRGLSEEEAIALARARGVPQNKIDLMVKRMNELRSKSSSDFDQEDETDMMDDESWEEKLSEKADIDSSEIDQRIFGFQFFNNERLTFEPNVNIPVPDSYVLGIGDQMNIDVWGLSQKSYSLEINRNGAVYIPEIGQVQVAGIALVDAKAKLLQKLSVIYSDLKGANPRTFASVTVENLNPIRINVIGEVFVPGTYTLPGTATAFNALYLAGGPNKNGSFREIHLIREGQLVTKLDVYDFLINGNTQVNASLRDNDVILVPAYLNRVRVGGWFKREGIFESVQGEHVGDIIRYAGGFKEDAYRGTVDLYRNNGKQKQFKSIREGEFEQIALQSGDSIYVGKIVDRFENRVSIEGAVYRPGNYELTEGLTLKGLIELADGVKEDAFMNRGIITRLNPDLSMQNVSFHVADVMNGNQDMPIRREDAVTILSINDLREERVVNISGEVQLPGEFEYRDNMTLSDLIFMAGGFLESATEASIEISRRLNYEEANQFNNKIAHVFQFSVNRNLSLLGADARFIIQPFDQVYVRRAPSFAEWGAIKVLGEVMHAGEYSLTSKNERISDIVKRTGGLSPDAYPEGAMLTRRVEVSNKVKRLRQELMLRDSTLTFSDMDFDVVGVDLSEIMQAPGGRKDIFMRPGDELVIPREMQTVKISGEVLNPLSVSFEKGKGIKRYVDQGGGFSVDAKKGRTYVIYANGVASSTKNYLFFRSFPRVTAGSEIVVPKKPEREAIPASTWVGLGSAIASIGLTIATIISLNQSTSNSGGN